MKLIVGLGNPGSRYQNTRHNIGHMVVDAIKGKVPSGVIAVKTDCFMNESGDFVDNLVARYKLNTSDLWVIHDDLDIPLGSYKIQKTKGPKTHKGVLSIEEKLGTNDFWRVRVGVENRGGGKTKPGEEYVLEEFEESEEGIKEKVIKQVSQALIQKLTDEQS